MANPVAMRDVRLVAAAVGVDPEFGARLATYWRDLGVEPPPAWHLQYLRRLSAENGRSRYAFWGESAGARVGLAILRLEADWMWPERRVGHIAEFTVFQPWRRRGVGRVLARACRDWLRAQGCGAVELDVLPGNVRAHAFWQAIGGEAICVRMRLPLH